ncbi:MAG TPA: hypothetical protein VK464_05155 [Symbiobacteriaceae bacterium]|nr:hypothetical protein [Symbiobacteriaceae bacterium]
MDEVHEILKAIMARLEAADAERAGFRREVMEKFDAVDSELKGLRAEVAEFRAGTHERLEKIEEHLDYLKLKWMEHDEEILKIKRRQA